MNADREPNRLPLRAGAMLLLAVAVVFIGLGWSSAAKSGDESPQEKLAKSGSQSTASSVVSSEGKSSSAATSEAPKSTTAGAADVPALCVLNAGSTKGWAKDVSDQLKSAGFTIGSEPGNLSTSSVTENTIFYGEGQEDAAQKVADAVPGGASLSVRPPAFTRCEGELAVVVVNP
ncbi:LytR C-terminal domain-containing protein [Gordonia phosphorivorans]|uniref:LytR C-terminal domain-containing protein n=1 Tax=Gordonia phosphorivorans TaxID=1056982 RepID=A0ABV6H661_9ACTN